MTIHLGRPLPDASRDRPGRRRGNPLAGPSRGCRRAVPIWSCSRWGLPCRRRRRRRGALLPHPFTLAGGPLPRPAVCFLWHCPWGRPRRALPGTVFPWSPDFPPPPPRKRRRRPSGRLARLMVVTRQHKARSAATDVSTVFGRESLSERASADVVRRRILAKIS